MSDESVDVIVIGSGIAGSLVATELARAGASVTILEAGPRLDREMLVRRLRASADSGDPTTLYGDANAPALKQAGPDPYSPRAIRAVGGTTWSWAGACWRFLPADFRLLSLYGVGRDWPFGYDELERYYGLAEAVLGVAGPDNDDLGSPRSTPYPMSLPPLSWNDQRVMRAAHSVGLEVKPEPAARNSRPFDGRPTCCGSATCMPVCPTGALFGGVHQAAKAEAAGAILIPDAACEVLEQGADGRIEAARVTIRGERQRLRAAHFVLAAGGIETPRLLLASGLCKTSGQLGCNLMDHPAQGVSFIANEDLWSGRGPVEMTSITSFRDGPFRATEAAAKLHLSNASHLTGAAWSAIGAGFTGRRLDAEIRRIAARMVTLSSFHEDIPDPQNKVELGGDGQVRVHYRLSDYVKRGAARTRKAMEALAQAMEGTDLKFEPGLISTSHPMGTTIMGSDPARSVVDPEGRTHDHPNLWVAGSSVFPSGAAVNPTLTIAALSLRLADSLQQAAK